MALPLWYYRGRTTTPIKTAVEGSFVLVPRQKFRASLAEVAHLRKLGLVVPAKEKVGAMPQPEPEAQPKSEPKAENKGGSQLFDGGNEPESEDAVIASTEEGSSEEGEGEGTSSKPMEMEKEKASRKGRRGQRRS
jgi:hypothetical protein